MNNTYILLSALTHLDKIKVWGKQIRVAPSKHPIVQMPTDLQADGAKLTKDYTNSPLHRYKKKGSKNYQNIYPPSATLHLSNIPYVSQTVFLKHSSNISNINNYCNLYWYIINYRLFLQARCSGRTAQN